MTLDLTGVDLVTETLHTNRLLLRPFRPEDVDPVHRAGQDAQTQRWVGLLPVPYTREDAHRWVEDVAPRERADGLGLSVVFDVDGEYVGSGGLQLRSGRLGPEIGYTVAPWARGRGYAAEAAAAMAEWALRRGAPRVHLFADVANLPSHAVARRAGFTQEGTVRACLEYRDGSRGDAALFGRLVGD